MILSACRSVCCAGHHVRPAALPCEQSEAQAHALTPAGASEGDRCHHYWYWLDLPVPGLCGDPPKLGESG